MMPNGEFARCIHGGRTIVLPVIQDDMYMLLEPMRFEIDIDPLAADNQRISVHGHVSVAISTKPEIMQNAAQRLLGLDETEFTYQASDITRGQFSLAFAESPMPSIAALPR